MTAVTDCAQILLPTNLLPLAALGLLAGQSADRAFSGTLLLFAAGLMVGAIAIAFAVRDPPASIALLALAAIAGLLVAVGRPPLPAIRLALAFGSGAALMLNVPPQAATISVAIAAQLGTGLAALAALGLVGLLTMDETRNWQRIAVRILGSWIAASAILTLALRLVR
jgi:hypothetical protein